MAWSHGLSLLLLAVAIAAQQQPPKAEFIQLKVRKLENQEELQVSLRFHVIEGFVHLNGQKVDHTVVNAIHLQTLITCHGRMHPAQVHVRVLVTEAKGENGARILSVQEEILEVGMRKVVQIKVHEVVLIVGKQKNEISRSVNVITLEESKIHKISSGTDKHVHVGGKLPRVPLKASKQDMEMFRKGLKPPHHPDHPLTGESEEGDDSYDDENEGHHKHHHGHRHHGHHKHHKHHGHGHHKHHHHHGKHHHGHGFSSCRWFHRLPLAARIAISGAVLLIGGGMIGCCVKCLCCKGKKAEGEKEQEVEEEKKKEELDYDMAGPLPTKKPLDEMKLIV